MANAPLGKPGLILSKAVAAMAFVVIAAFGVYDAVSDELDFASIMIIGISALGAVGFGLSFWADK